VEGRETNKGTKVFNEDRAEARKGLLVTKMTPRLESTLGFLDAWFKCAFLCLCLCEAVASLIFVYVCM
jgi:hypothetical protein